MSAARNPLPPPDMGGVNSDWKTLQDLRRREAEKDREANRAEPPPDVPEEKEAPAAPVPSRKPGRSRGGRRPAPAVKDAVAHTVRLDPEEANEVDMFVLMLRAKVGRTRLDKSEVYRELVRMAREDETVQRKLLRRL